MYAAGGWKLRAPRGSWRAETLTARGTQAQPLLPSLCAAHVLLMFTFTVTQRRENALRQEAVETLNHSFETVDGAVAWLRAELTTMVGITLDSAIRPYPDRLAANRLRVSCHQLMAEHLSLAMDFGADPHLRAADSIEARAEATYWGTAESMDALRTEFDLAYGRLNGAGDECDE